MQHMFFMDCMNIAEIMGKAALAYQAPDCFAQGTIPCDRAVVL